MDGAGMMQSQCCGRDAFQLHELRPEASRHIPLLVGRFRVALLPSPPFMADFTVMQLTKPGPQQNVLGLRNLAIAIDGTETPALASDR